LKRPHNGNNRYRSASLSGDFDHDHADAHPWSVRTGRRFVGNQGAVAKAAAKAHLATIKRFCMRALPVLIAAAALTGIIALKAAIYSWRFHY
jgi:hypothetical protein